MSNKVMTGFIVAFVCLFLAASPLALAQPSDGGESDKSQRAVPIPRIVYPSDAFEAPEDEHEKYDRDCERRGFPLVDQNEAHSAFKRPLSQ